MPHARYGSEHWGAELLDGSDDVDALAELMALGLEGEAAQVASSALPWFVHWLEKTGASHDRRAIPLVDAALMRSNLLMSLSDDERTVILDLVRTRLELGIVSEAYRTLLDDWTSCLKRDAIRSARIVGWGLDLLDLFLEFPRPVVGSVFEFASVVVGLVREFRDRVSEADHIRCSNLCMELGYPPYERVARGEGARAEASAFADLGNATILIYTLTERAARQAAAVLKELAPSARVELAHDGVNSDRLRDLARNSDLVVLCWKSATHAASSAIESARGGRPIVRPAGKGCSSILSNIRDWSATRAEAA